VTTFLNWLSLPRLLAAIVFIAIFTMAVRAPADSDTWWHLRSGQYIVETRSIPTTDPFSHTREGQPWIDHGWLAQVFWYALYAAGGWAGLSLGLAAVVTISFGLIWQIVPGNQYVRAFSLVLGAITSAIIWAVRPQMISFLLAALILFLLERYKRGGRRWIYALPLVILLWANVHGGYAIAFMIMAVYIAGETLDHLTGHQDDPILSWRQISVLVALALISFFVVAINPHGWEMWAYPLRTVGIGALRDYIQEWRSPDFHQTMTWPFVAMLTLTLVAMGRSIRRADWTDLALTAMWSTGSFFAWRNMGLYGLLTVPVLARYADAAWGGYLPGAASDSSARRPALLGLNWLLLGVLTLAALLNVGLKLSPQTMSAAQHEDLPVSAVQFVHDNKPAGPIFNSYNWGGYLIFELWPEYPVYVDGRTDLYDDAFLRRYLNIVVTGAGWQQALDEDGINLVFIETNSQMAKLLRGDPNWMEAYQDELAVIFVRKNVIR
jgi:hypothetical protein